MESKLQQLTEKLYNEGLSKGLSQAQQMVEQANAESTQIIAQAKAQAEQIVSQANKEAAELKKNTENEIRLLASQMESALRQRIEQVLVAAAFDTKVSDAWRSGEFVQRLVVEAVKAWNPTSEQGLQLVLPESTDKSLMEEIKATLGSSLANGVELVTDSRLKVPFRIAPRGAGYYVSFTDEDFDALFKSYLRPKISELLYGKKQ